MAFDNGAGEARRIGRALTVALLATNCTGALMLGLARTATAQTAGAQTSFSVPAGPMSAALASFGRQAGLQVTYLPEIAVGARSPGISGPATANAALSRLLEGSGLTYRFTNAGTVAIQRPSRTDSLLPEGAIPLDTIDVLGESAWGPANGFVARRSATASKTDTPLIETPQTVNIVTAEEIKARQPRTLAETLRYTPGVVSEFQPHTTYFDRTRVRGFYSVNNFYLDGMQLTPAGTGGVAQIDPVHVERVEILKGPASVLYGQNGTGGLINMVSKRPQLHAHREIGVSLGNKNMLEGYFDVGGAAKEDGTLLYRVTGVGRHSNADVDGNKIERWSIAPSVTWRPNAATSLTILSGYQYDPEGSSGAYHPIVGTVLPSINGRVSRALNTSDPSFASYERKQAYIGTIFEHDFSEALKFRQSARVMHVDVNYNSLRLGAVRADQRTFARTAERASAQTSGFSVDNNLLYKFNLGPVRNELLTGFDYRYFRSRNWAESGTSAALNFDILAPRYGGLTIPALATRTNNLVGLTQYGLYAQNQMSLGNWRFVAGLRQDWSKSDTTDHRLSSTTVDRDQAMTGRAGLVYLFDNGFAPYVSYSTSFEPTSGTDYFGKSFKPTEGEQWEAGLRYQPAGVNASFSLAAYQLTRQNVSTADNAHSCVNAPTLANCGSYSIQTGEIRVRGLEFEGKLSLADGLNATLAYAYMDAEVTKSNGSDLGNRPTNTPRHMASGWVSYLFGQGPLAGLTVAGGARYMGSMYADAANRNTIPSYTLFDAMISYDLVKISPTLKGATIQVNATNLADKKAVGGCWSESFCDYVGGRSVVASMRYRF